MGIDGSFISKYTSPALAFADFKFGIESGMSALDMDWVRSCFQNIDADGNGTISKRELAAALSKGDEVEDVKKLKHLLGQHGVRLDGGVDAIFYQLDWDDDKEIDFRELIKNHNDEMI